MVGEELEEKLGEGSLRGGGEYALPLKGRTFFKGEG